MITEAKRLEILEAGQDVSRTKAAYDAAVKRFDMLIESAHRAGSSIPITASVSEVSLAPIRKGKATDPGSINQRVFSLIEHAGPKSIDSLAEATNATPKQVRHAIVYHQKRGRVIRVGRGMYDLKMRMNGNGASAEQSNLTP